MEDMSYKAGWHRFGMLLGHAMAVSHSDTFALLSFMLVDKNMLDAMVRTMNLESGEQILEVGPGL